MGFLRAPGAVGRCVRPHGPAGAVLSIWAKRPATRPECPRRPRLNRLAAVVHGRPERVRCRAGRRRRRSSERAGSRQSGECGCQWQAAGIGAPLLVIVPVCVQLSITDEACPRAGVVWAPRRWCMRVVLAVCQWCDTTVLALRSYESRASTVPVQSQCSVIPGHCPCAVPTQYQHNTCILHAPCTRTASAQ